LALNRGILEKVGTWQPADAYELVRALLIAEAHDRDIALDIACSVRGSGQKCPSVWNRAADEAEHHGVAPLLEPIVSAVAQDTAEPAIDQARRQFVALANRHRRAAQVREHCVDELLIAFGAAGLRVVLLKGSALAHLIYPSPALRPMVDIDILIEPAAADRCVGVASRLGYQFAPRYPSRFAGRMHHLPAAVKSVSGFAVSLEIHLDAMSPDHSERLTLTNLAGAPRPFPRGGGPRGFTLGHIDMLRHLTRHAFEPARRTRLKQLYDVWRYQTVFAEEIDRVQLGERFPQVTVALDLVKRVFAKPIRDAAQAHAAVGAGIPEGMGLGMAPLSEISAMPFAQKLDALFNPSPWWLHGFYGVPTDRSLLLCRTVRHPVTLARWLARRLRTAIVPPPPFMPVEDHGERAG
jgi:hypothetical protein